MHPLTWWILFILAGIWAQRFVAGVDFLAPGLIICLQEGKIKHALWLALVLILLQEGMGGLAFGAGILWYGALTVFFFIGRWLFESKNLLFILIIGAGMGVWHFFLVQMMASLQDMVASPGPLFMESVLQAVVFSVQWVFVHSLYKRWVRHEHAL